MGEMAEDMVDGTACSQCGCYFLDIDDHESLYVHGYPVLCWDCWNGMTDEERIEAKKNGLQRAEVRTI